MQNNNEYKSLVIRQGIFFEKIKKLKKKTCQRLYSMVEYFLSERERFRNEEI